MITKAEILTIDYNSNTCNVRIPYFENGAGGDKAVEPAIFTIPPGVFNGYQTGDIVMVAFEDGQPQSPCVIGKLYLGAVEEAKLSRGSISCSNLVSQDTTINTNTKLNTNSSGITVDGSAVSYNSLTDLITKFQEQSLLIQKLTARVEELEKK